MNKLKPITLWMALSMFFISCNSTEKKQENKVTENKPITINSDDLLLFDSGVSQEYLFLYKLALFNIDELNQIRKNSLV